MRKLRSISICDLASLNYVSEIMHALHERTQDFMFTEFKGAFVENYVAQQLRSEKQIDLYYWTSEGKMAELDFLCEFGSQIYPLEAKAGISPKSKSLNSYDQQFRPPILSRATLLNLRH